MAESADAADSTESAESADRAVTADTVGAVGAAYVADATAAAPGPARRQIEDKLPRGILIRVLVYVFAGHAVAGFIYLLFTLGGNQ
ncbi:DUF6126 family protein [Streptomyces fractus]|uniref:DUF6126 family protein n=1 Tax=Streptomyces fractus TaxID=641806 RepID=UPI003CF1FD15